MKNTLFTPATIGSLTLPNRLVRSATMEAMADLEGRPLPKLVNLYRDLARGGVGLIISGHMYIHPTGKPSLEMTGVYADDLIPGLAELARVVHQEGGKVFVQINHAGMMSSEAPDPFAPSATNTSVMTRQAREMNLEEIEMVIQAFGQAARRVKEAGFDGVQIHGAHGYLINQFLSPLINRRKDEWGGDITGRMRILQEVCKNVRSAVGPDYPMITKLGMCDHVEGGLTAAEGAQVVATMQEMGLDGVEISGGFGPPRISNIRKGIRSEKDEAYFLPLARMARPVTRLPILLVGGFRSRTVMERVLDAGEADFISLSRPFICEPDFANRLRDGIQERSRCISANNCWAVELEEGIACKCPL